MLISLFFQMDFTKYNIDKNDEELKSLIECDHGKKSYYIHKRICELAVNSFVVLYEKWFEVEIDAKENEHLLKYITLNFFMKILKSRQIEKKLGHYYEIGNLYRTIRVYK